MIRRTGGGARGFLGVAAGAVVALGIGGLSLAIAASEGGEDSARVEQARGNAAQELVEARRAAEAARGEIERLDRIRANQFQELVTLRREAASLRQELEAAVTARAEVDTAEIARLNRVRQNLFEELVGTRRELAAAQARLQTAASAPVPAELTDRGQQTGSLASQAPVSSAQRLMHRISAGTSATRAVTRPAGTSVQRGPVAAIISPAPARPSSLAKTPSPRVEKIVPAKQSATIRAEVRRAPKALPSALMLHGSAN